MIRKLMANVSKRSIQVPIGIRMAGYGDRKQGNIGTHDEIYTKALAIFDGLEKYLIITNDLLCVDDLIVKDVIMKINMSEKIEEKNIFICASHTHSGPDICRWQVSDNIHYMDYKYQKLRNEVVDTIANNAIQALNNLIPVEIGFNKGECMDVTCNRIDKNLPADYSVNVIEIRKLNGKPLCIIVNYSCHPTILGSDNLYISADFPGVLQRLLEKYFSEEAIAMFINGACGNLSTRFTREKQDFNEVFRMGNILFESVIDILGNITNFKSSMEIRSFKSAVEFPKKQLPSYNEVMEKLKIEKSNMESMVSSSAKPYEIRKAVTKYQGISITIELIKHLRDKKLLSEIQLMRLGDIMIVGVPVELFVEYGIEIKNISKYKNTIIAGYTNNMLGYVYTPESYESYEYEAWSSPFDKDTGEFLVKKVKELILEFEK